MNITFFSPFHATEVLRHEPLSRARELLELLPKFRWRQTPQRRPAEPFSPRRRRVECTDTLRSGE
jgi:hypothetical protein